VPSQAASTDGPPVVGLREVATLASVSKTRAAELVRLPGFPAATELAQGKVWWRSEVVAFVASWRAGPAQRKAIRLPARWTDAEAWVRERLQAVLGTSIDHIDSAGDDRGWDFRIGLPDGRQVMLQVKAISNARSARGDFTVGALAGDPERADGVLALVDMTTQRPWPVYLAGARTVAALARARHDAYERARGRDADHPGSWGAKVSRELLERMSTRERWELLLEHDPTRVPPAEPFLEQARQDAPRPRTTTL
jgi:hypothetical protein